MWRLRQLLFRIYNVLRPHRADVELDREVNAHLTLLEDDFRRRGMTAEEARKAALRAIGGKVRTKELQREARSLLALDHFMQDLRFSLRVLATNPVFSIVAVLTLAIGIGATTSIFSQVNAVFWRRLPVERPEELRTLVWTSPKPGFVALGQVIPGPHLSTGDSFASFSHLAYLSMRNGTIASFSDLACWLDPGEVRPVVLGELGFGAVQFVSGNYFKALGVHAILGRTLEPDDDQPGSSATVAVATYRFWQRAFGGDPDITKKPITLNGSRFTIVGVLPEGFFGVDPAISPDLMVPIQMVMMAAAGQGNILLNPAQWIPCRVFGRLRRGVTDEQARGEAEAWLQESVRANPVPARVSYELPKLSMLSAEEAADSLRNKTGRPITILMVVVSTILVIACANIAGLLLSRSSARQKEIATRLSLGAPRFRLIQQLLTESVLLSTIGGIAGVLLAYLLNMFNSNLLGHFMPLMYGTTRNLGIDARPDLHVLTFSAAIVLLTGIAFGLTPAIRMTRVDLLSVMKQVGTSANARTLGLSSGQVMVALQVALSMVLLIGAGLFVRTVINLRSTALGYKPEGLLYVRIEPRTGGITTDRRADFFENAVKHLESTSGVITASAAVFPALLNFTGQGGNSDTAAACTADFNPQDPVQRAVKLNFIAPKYFQTLQLQLLLGRDLEWSDRPQRGHPPVAVVNEAFVKKYYRPGKNPIGETFGANLVGDTTAICPYNTSAIRVVGVVADSKMLPRSEPVPTIYLPLGAPSNPVTIVLRTAQAPARMVAEVRRSMAEFDSNVPLFGDISLTDLREQQLKQERLLSNLLLFFGGFALLLCCLGIYGLLSYSVSKRISEIGIRMALGARKQEVVRLVVSESLEPVVLGLSAGTLATFGLARFVRSLLFGMSRPDATTISAAIALFLLVSCVAVAVPAIRATQIDPLKALRHE